MTALQLLEWKWPEVFQNIPKEIIEECFEYEREIIQDSWNNGYQFNRRCGSPIEYYDKVFKMPHEQNVAEVCIFCNK